MAIGVWQTLMEMEKVLWAKRGGNTLWVREVPKHCKNCKCVSLLVVRKDCHEFRFSTIRIIISVSNVSWIVFVAAIVLAFVIIFLAVRSCLLNTLIKCLKGNKFLGLLLKVVP